MEQMDLFGGSAAVIRDSLKLEQDRIKRELSDGTHCAACGQFAKEYKYPIHSTLALSLFRLKWAAEPGAWVHITDVAAKMPRVTLNGDFGKLAWWGLTEQKQKDPNVHIAGRTTGLWRMTPKGLQFLLNEIRVPRHCFNYNNTIMGWSDEMVGIKDCLKKKFDYDRLMAGEL